MPAQNPQVTNPRYGFTPKFIPQQQVTDAAPTGTAIARPAGLRQVLVFAATNDPFGGPGEVNLIIEGSNDGSGWVTVGQLTSTDYFTAQFQEKILSGGSVDLQHWRFFRVRSAIVSGAPTYTITVLITGIARDCECFLRGDEEDLIFANRLGATPLFEVTPAFRRPAGTLLTNLQVQATGVVLGGITSFIYRLQGSPDNGTTWVNIGSVDITADGTYTMTVDGDSFFSLGSYSLLRFAYFVNGGPGPTTAFTALQAFMTLDSCDWVIDDASSSSGGSLGDAFIAVDFGAPGAEVGDTIAIAGQVFDTNGSPLLGVRKIELVLSDTSEAGDLDLANNAQFSAVNTGTAIAGIGTNRIVLDTDASGVFDVDVNDVAAETVYLSAVNPRGPVSLANPQIVAASAEADLTFA